MIQLSSLLYDNNIEGETMENTTDFVKDIDFNFKTTDTSVSTEPQHQLGQIHIGPYLPIQSGSYNVDVILTSDFNTFEIKDHY